MNINNNTIALVGLLVIALVALFINATMAEKIVTLITGGVLGWMTKGEPKK